MSLVRPSVNLTVDGRALTAPEAAAAAIEVELGLGPAHDQCRILLHPLSPLIGTAPGAQIAVEIGKDADSLTQVFTGVLRSVQRGPNGALLLAGAPSLALAKTRAAQAYLSQTVADIVNDLLGKAGVTAGTVDADLSLAAYHISERRSAWAHVCALARLAGCEVASEADGALSLRPPRSGPADASLRHGAELLAWEAEAREDGEAAPGVKPSGAGSEEGAEKWHVLLREPDDGSPSAPVLVGAALRDRDAASAVQQALEATVTRRAARGRALAMGDASLRPGMLVDLDELPGGDFSGRLVEVVHLVDGQGFTSRLRLGGLA